MQGARRNGFVNRKEIQRFVKGNTETAAEVRMICNLLEALGGDGSPEETGHPLYEAKSFLWDFIHSKGMVAASHYSINVIYKSG